jgi:hypothetical protein
MPDSIQESFFRHNLRIFKNLVLNNQWPEINKPENIKRIDEVIQKCTERGQKVFTKSPGGFNVLNHGDFFMRNMLFLEIDGKVSDVRFVSCSKKFSFHLIKPRFPSQISFVTLTRFQIMVW